MQYAYPQHSSTMIRFSLIFGIRVIDRLILNLFFKKENHYSSLLLVFLSVALVLHYSFRLTQPIKKKHTSTMSKLRNSHRGNKTPMNTDKKKNEHVNNVEG